MADLVPPIYFGTNLNSERDVFEWFQTDRATADWKVFHSVQIGNHVSQVQGEADFIVVIPGQGVVVLENKSWDTIRVENGRWQLGSGGTIYSQDDPFKQAEDNCQSVIQHLKDCGIPGRKVLVAWAVIFPNGHYHRAVSQSLDRRDVRVIDHDDLWESEEKTQEEVLRERLIAVLDNLRHVRNENTRQKRDNFLNERFTPEMKDRVCQCIRSDFVVATMSTVSLDRERVEAKNCTSAQNHILECLEENPRILLQGAAGTGKTFVAQYVVKREASRHSDDPKWRIGLFCYNSLLGKELSNWAEKTNRKHIVAGTLGSFVEKKIKAPKEISRLQVSSKSERAGLLESVRNWLQRKSASAPSTDSEWNDAIGAQDTDQFLNLDAKESSDLFDMVVVDEFQDVLTENNFRILDRILKGGLAKGRWMICGDYENQLIQKQVGAILSPDQLENEKHLSFTYCRLKENCRNPPSVCKVIERHVSPKRGYTKKLRKETPFETEIIPLDTRDPLKRVERIEKAVREVLSKEFKPADIVVQFISAEMLDAFYESVESRPALSPSTGWTRYGKEPSKIRLSTTRRFKGLDSPAVIFVLDEETTLPPSRQAADTENGSLLYVGLSRASSLLVVLAPQKVIDELKK